MNNFTKRSGSAFITVVAVLGIIMFAASAFLTSTIGERRETSISAKGLAASQLAEASLERAMRLISKDINNMAESKPDSFAVKLRLPAAEGASTLGLAENLGADKILKLSEDAAKEVVFTKDDLQPTETEKDLDELIKYITNDTAVSYDVTVKAKLVKAFRISPGKSYDDFKVPGVDVPWNLRTDVESFLNGNGYSAFTLAFPKSMRWLDFSIPIEIAGFKIANIDLNDAVNFALPKLTLDGKDCDFKTLTSFDFMADKLLNSFLAKGNPRKVYPIKVSLDKIRMPKTVAELWPEGTHITASSNQYLEKYGQVAFECEASIKYKGNYTATRRLTAIKDFKTADCEPPAPMYSFFVNNLANARIAFNNYGGAFYVNSFDYTGMFSKIKEVFTGTSKLSDEEIASREYPGLIRVNYDGKDKPIMCNVSLLGGFNEPTIEGDELGMIKDIFSGIEALIMLGTDSGMAVVGAKYNVNAEIVDKTPGSAEQVPVVLKGTYDPEGSGSDKSPFDSAGKYGLSGSGEGSVKVGSIKDVLKSSIPKPDFMNFIPEIGKMSSNVISLAISLALKPLVAAIPLGPVKAKVPDCFEKWEMPYMGTENPVYPLPTLGTGANRTHLFGYGGLHPTLTREIEGNVMKRYRQWAMTIVAMKPSDRLPLLPFPPVFLPPPPIVVPIWKTSDVLTKYDFNMTPFKSIGEGNKADTSVHAYDPSLVSNMAPNLYTNEQYAKKATYYYDTAEAFYEDLPNRLTEVNGKKVFVLNGITYISGTVGSQQSPFNVEGGTFYVVGRGMIVCSGNFYMGCNIVALDRSKDENTVFSLICRSGGLLIMQGDKKFRFEGSLYTDKGIYLHTSSSLHIVGNWVTNMFNKGSMGGTVVVDYVSSRVRSSLGSLHPERGKYDPRRYHVSFSPQWASWRAH